MKRFFVSLVIAASLCLSTVASAASASAARSFVDGLATQVLELVRNDAIGKQEKQAKIEAIFSDKVDINYVAKFVLGKHWRTATPQQQADYIGAYRPFILKNYASKLTKYSGQTYTLKNAVGNSDGTIVTMLINDTDGKSFNVDYRLQSAGGSFKIVDIAVEGVSLLTTQRSEFSSVVESKGVDGLIAALQKQVVASK